MVKMQDLGSASSATDFLRGKSHRPEFSKVATDFDASILGFLTLDDCQARQNPNLPTCHVPSTSAVRLPGGEQCARNGLCQGWPKLPIL